LGKQNPEEISKEKITNLSESAQRWHDRIGY